MKVCVIKTSSMGDVIHTLPALTDAQRAIPNLSIDWVVEENFAKEIQGERNILAKYKEFWSYFAKSYRGGEKGLKEIRKAKNLAEYKAAKYRFFAESHFQVREGLSLCF